MLKFLKMGFWGMELSIGVVLSSWEWKNMNLRDISSRGGCVLKA